MGEKKKVALGMSGGVDSSVSVYLLQQAGYEVLGVTMQLMPEHYGLPAGAVDDAKRVADKLGIAHYVVDFRTQFEAVVIADFISEYAHGRTPNPCILCNQQVKFKLLADYAWQLGADFMATGHYAKVERDSLGRYHLKKGDDFQKDQSYFLSQIDRAVLAKLLLPLSGYSKDEVRALAETLGLTVANKPDSQEICFIPDNDYKGFLRQVTGQKQFQHGVFLDTAGQKLGEHQGVQQYTIGQRKGLGIALGKPAYVVGIDAANNQVLLGDEAALFRRQLVADKLNFLVDLPLDTPIPVEAKIRYRAQPAAATLMAYADGHAEVVFAEAQRAITPGQGVCFYRGDTVLGGGTIRA